MNERRYCDGARSDRGPVPAPSDGRTRESSGRTVHTMAVRLRPWLRTGGRGATAQDLDPSCWVFPGCAPVREERPGRRRRERAAVTRLGTMSRFSSAPKNDWRPHCQTEPTDRNTSPHPAPMLCVESHLDRLGAKNFSIKRYGNWLIKTNCFDCFEVSLWPFV